MMKILSIRNDIRYFLNYRLYIFLFFENGIIRLVRKNIYIMDRNFRIGMELIKDVSII